MIPHSVDIFVCLAPIDLRWSFDRLAGMVREHIGRDPRCRAMFVFFGKRRSAVKVFFYDGTGLCQFYKRLDRGNFRLPEPRGEGEPYVELGERDLDELLDGIKLDNGLPKKSNQRLH
jgi:transposase